MTTTLKDHAETLERLADVVPDPKLAQTGSTRNALRSIAADLRARDEAAQERTVQAAPAIDDTNSLITRNPCPDAAPSYNPSLSKTFKAYPGATFPAPAVGDTPRTDKLWAAAVLGFESPFRTLRGVADALRDHAKELERELNAALAAQERKE